MRFSRRGLGVTISAALILTGTITNAYAMGAASHAGLNSLPTHSDVIHVQSRNKTARNIAIGAAVGAVAAIAIMGAASQSQAREAKRSRSASGKKASASRTSRKSSGSQNSRQGYCQPRWNYCMSDAGQRDRKCNKFWSMCVGD